MARPVGAKASAVARRMPAVIVPVIFMVMVLNGNLSPSLFEDLDQGS